ncbi:MAG TPA: chromosome segregation protein SMC [Ktedonobacterales bacterium]
MYLKRLELQGFKSFAPRTTLEFSPGVTAIVGPNGSGKCLVGSSLVTLDDGRRIAIRDLVDAALADSHETEALDDGALTRENPHRVSVLSLNPSTLRLESRPVTAFVQRTAPDHLLRIRTRTGREVIATPYHPLFSLDQGQLRAMRADEVQVGARVALARRLPTRHSDTPLAAHDTVKLFAEADRIYVPYSTELHAWARSARGVHGSWRRWSEAAQVRPTQLKGLLDGQAVNAAVLTSLALSVTPPPLTGALKSHGSTIIHFPTTLTADLARFLGLIIAEGRITVAGNVWFVNSDKAINEDYARLCQSLFHLKVFRKRYKQHAEDSILFSRTLGVAIERLFGVAVNSRSADKRIPPQLFRAPEQAQWAFLSGLFEGDAHVHLLQSKASARRQAYLEYMTASHGLANDVVSLLLQLGVYASVQRKVKYATNTERKLRRTYYAVYIYGVEHLETVARHLRFVGKKQAALDALTSLAVAANPNHDLVPGATALVNEAAKLARVSIKRYRAGRPKLAAYYEGRCEASRNGLLEVTRQIEEVGETPSRANAVIQQLRTLATSDVYWDKVASVEEIAPPDPWVYDLCVDETHNFVAENVIVHNSNIADSIRWVLGEQSMRQLRGKKSDDVIFAGGQGRAQMQMAQVGLTLDNSSGWIPSEFSEVSIARRSFRSGEMEYLSNAQRVRLKDVLLLLAQARIGHDSYTVVGQGMVDQALSLRAEERRALFEDAAGIRSFQAQRTDAEQKLNLTQTNISRLRDIIGEIEPRLGPLAEQARRAHEFSGARDELTRLLRVWYRRQWRESQLTRQAAEASEAQLGARIQELQASLAREEESTRELRERREALIAEIGVLRRERGEASGRLQTTERDLAVGKERLASLSRQRIDLDTEQEQQVEAVDVARAHVGALEAQTAQAEGRADVVADEVDRLERDQHGARQEQERAEAQLRAAQRDVIQAQARIGSAQTELGRLQRQLGERNRALAARRDAVATAQRKLDTANAQHAERREAFELARSAVESLVAERDALAHELTEGQAEIERLRAAVADGERERKAATDRLTLLEEWRRNMDGFGDGVQALLRASDEERPPMIGVVAQLITVTPGLELAVEAALGPFLQAVVVAQPDDARQAAAWLRAGSAGHALFLWAGSGDTDAPIGAQGVDGVEVIAQAHDAITAQAGVRSALARVLGGAVIVRDLAAAERFARDSGGATPAVTLGGEVVSGRVWMRGGAPSATTGGEAQEASALGRERDLRRLPAEIERLGREIEERRAQFVAASERQSQRRTDEERLKKSLQSAEAKAQELARAVTALQREQERAESEAHVSESVAEQLAAEAQGIEQEVTATVQRVAEQEAAQQEAVERVEDAQAVVDEIVARNRSQGEELNRARMSHALHKQEMTTLAQRAEQLRAQLRELEAQLARRDERLRAIESQREQLETATAEQEGAIAILRERVRTLGEALRTNDEAQAEMERQIASLERGQSAERQELARLEVEYRRAIVDAQRARDAIETLSAQIRDELGVEGDVDPLPAIVGSSEEVAPDAEEPESPPTPEEVAKMRRQIDSLRSRLKNLGGYDPEAPQQYAELKTRYDFMSSQMYDMQEASANLRQIITELDNTMRRQFVETFHRVNERFQQHFVTLFSGGAARLELTAPKREQSEDEDEEDGAAQEDQKSPRKTSFGGVEVFVQIPGKRVQDLSLLSGGERAMVSAALLFALLETNPPPFCLLDEVDAALDEANVVRFCEILKQLAERTQFIVITHNRVTMTHANAIYGVSMGPDSVSRVLSMRLAEVPLAL